MGADLADFVRNFLETHDLSEDDIARNSDREISQGYVNNIKNRAVLPESLTVKKIRAMARGMGITEEEMFARVRGVYYRNNSLLSELSNYVKELPENRQKDLLEIAKTFFRLEAGAPQKDAESVDPPAMPKENKKTGKVKREIVDGVETVIIDSPEDVKTFRQEQSDKTKIRKKK